MSRRSQERLAAHRGFFSIGIVHGKSKQNIGTLFRSAVSYGADFVFTVGARYDRQCSDTTKTPLHTPLFCYDDVDDLRRHLPWGCPLVGIELTQQSQPLPGFTHPVRACYLLGAEDHGLSVTDLAKCHRLVHIPAGIYCLNVAVAGSIVMYDRIVKALRMEVAA